MSTIGELARQAGVSVHTLRWYEAQGLFPVEVPRDAAGRRDYPDEAALWLLLIGRFRQSRMPIAEIRRYADLVRAGAGNEQARIDLMAAHAETLTAEIEILITAREVIEEKIAAYRHAVDARAAAPAIETSTGNAKGDQAA